MDRREDPWWLPPKPPRFECTCLECGRAFQERDRHPGDTRLLCPRCRREMDQD
jgi:formylmethanofuran dehydrogenase subunit E